MKVIKSVVHGVSIFITKKMVAERLNLSKITLTNYCPKRRKKIKIKLVTKKLFHQKH
jgi:predicted DNA-binding protein (UPF0251 family)